MARMYSGKRGKSGSTKPLKKSIPSWVNYKAKEVELLVYKLSKEGKTSSEIGLYLRDAYGIPDVKFMTKKTITQLLKEKNLLPEFPEDLLALMKRALSLRKHLELNKNDQVAKRGLLLTESKIRKLIKYYKKNQKVKDTWKYNPKDLNLYVG